MTNRARELLERALIDFECAKEYTGIDYCITEEIRAYLAEPEAKPFVRLSEDEIMDLCRGKCVEFRWPSTAIETARAIEDALEEKNK